MGKLLDGVNETTPIMPRCKNSKVKIRSFHVQYGDETIFTYGCEPERTIAIFIELQCVTKTALLWSFQQKKLCFGARDLE